MHFTLIIYKQFNFCRFRASAYTKVDRLCAVFLYNLLVTPVPQWQSNGVKVPKTTHNFTSLQKVTTFYLSTVTNYIYFVPNSTGRQLAANYPISIKFGTQIQIFIPSMQIWQKIEIFQIQDDGPPPFWK